MCVAEWAEKLTEMAQGKHHIGDFLPPDELKKFMETLEVCVDASTELCNRNLFMDYKH